MKCEFCKADLVRVAKATTKRFCTRKCSLAAWRERNRESLREYSNAWLHMNQERHTQHNREWRKRNTRRATIHTLTNRAVSEGRIIKKPCEVCGAVTVHAHHPDPAAHYSNINWLCAIHHKKAHMGAA